MRLLRVRAGAPVRLLLGLTAAGLVLAGCGSQSPSALASPAASTSPPATAGASAPTGPPTMPHSAPTGPPTLTTSALPWRLRAAVSREAAGVVSGSVVIAGGLTPGDVSVDRTWRIDPATGTVTALSPLPHAVHDVAGAVLGGNLLAIGGGRSSVYGYVQRVGPPGASAVVGQLPVARADVAALSTSRGVVVVGGYDGTTLAAPVLLSRDGRGFSTVAALPEPVRYPAVVADGDIVWVVGGEVSGHQVNVVQQVDLARRTARVVARLPYAIGHAAAAFVDGGLLVAGGRTDSGISDLISWLNLRTGQTSTLGHLPTPIADAGYVTVGSRLMLLGGETPTFSDRVLAVAWR